MKNEFVAISLANGNIDILKKEYREVTKNILNMNVCYGIKATKKNSKTISNFIKIRKIWDLDDWSQTVNKENWEQDIINYMRG